MRKKLVLKLAVWGVLFALFSLVSARLAPVRVWAQAGVNGAISGTVTDPSGAAIPRAEVVVINEATKLTVARVTGSTAGTFSVPLVPPGTYKVEITAPGFRKYEAPGVEVRVTEVTNVFASLKLGAATEVITVTSAAVQIQTSTPVMGETISGHSIEKLPLSTSNFFALATLSSGANTEIFDAGALGRGQVTINVNGNRPTNNNYQLEGVNGNDFNLPILDNVALPNQEAIGEFKTQTVLFDASNGRNGGGNIQVGLRYGSNKYHGAGWELFRDKSLNSNDFFLNRRGVPKPQLHQNQFGGSFGGPIPGGNKIKYFRDWFFFLDYQGTREGSGNARGTFFDTKLPVLPTDRSQASLIKTFFPKGLPPGFTNLDPVALALLNLPASKCPGFNDSTHCIPSVSGAPGLTARGAVVLGELTRSALGTYQDDQWVATSDKQLGANDRVNARFFWDKGITTQPFGGGSSLPFARGLPAFNFFAKAGWNHTISSNSVNEARVGFNRFFFGRAPSEPILLTDIGETRANFAQFPAASRYAISNAFSIGTGVNDERGGTFNTFFWADDYSRTVGRHTIRIGGDANRYELNRFNNFATRGSVAFANTTAGAGGKGIPALNGFQNFLLGRVTSTQGGSGFFTFFFRATDFAIYAQDDWKVHPRLTLNAGVRWERLETSHEKQNFLSNFRGLNDGFTGVPPLQIIHPRGTPRLGSQDVQGCTLTHCVDDNNFGPRVGFAFDPIGNHKTVVRGGYGIYFQRISNQSLLQTSGGEPFNQQFSAAPFSVTPENPFPFIRPASDFPLPFDQVIPTLVAFRDASGADPRAGCPAAAGCVSTRASRAGGPIFQSASGGPTSGFFFFPVRDLHAPYTEEWTFSVQHEIGRGWVGEAAYVGNHGVALLGPGRPLNAGQICTQNRPCVIPSNVAANVVVPAGSPFVSKDSSGRILITGNTPANIDARVPVTFLGLANSRGFFQENQGASIYHSLQATLSHKWGNGIYFQGAYTFSRLLDNGSGSQFGDELNGFTQFGDLFNPRSNRGLADFDRTHRITISYNYDLPFGRLFNIPKQGLLGKLANGWSINGVTTLQSGTPITVSDGDAVLLEDTDFINSSNFATLVPGAKLGDAITRGDVKKRLDNFIDLTKFNDGGNCVNNQNAIVPDTDPGCTGFSAVGNVQRNAFRGPWQSNWDFSVGKITKLYENLEIEFRAEFFNAFNHPAFAGPGAGGPGSSTGGTGFVDVSSGDSSILSTVNRPRIIQFVGKIRF